VEPFPSRMKAEVSAILWQWILKPDMLNCSARVAPIVRSYIYSTLLLA
jgi:hypothetical protein